MKTRRANVILATCLAGATFSGLVAAEALGQSNPTRWNDYPTAMSAEHGYPGLHLDIASSPNGPIVVVWSDYRHTWGENPEDYSSVVYAQVLSPQGEPDGGNVRISDLEPGVSQSGAAVSMNASGNFVVAWHRRDRKNDLWSIWARRYDSSARPLGPIFRVDDDDSGAGTLGAKVLLRNDESLIIIWTDRRDGPVYSYAQFYDVSGNTVGPNFRINPQEVQGNVQLNGFDDGRFFFNLDGRFLFFYDAGFELEPQVLDLGIPASAYPLSGSNVLLVWRSEDLTELYVGMMDIDSPDPQSERIRIDRDSEGYFKDSMAVAWDPERREVVILWIDHRQGYPGISGAGDIYAQHMELTDSDGLRPLGGNIQINYETVTRSQHWPGAILRNGYLVAVWLENWSCRPSPGPGLVVLGESSVELTRQSFDAPEASEGSSISIVSSGGCIRDRQDSLSISVFPNPVVDQATVVFSLPETGRALIDVFDVAGRRVGTLFDRKLLEGTHFTTLDATNLAPGLYVCRLRVASSTSSLVIIRIR